MNTNTQAYLYDQFTLTCTLTAHAYNVLDGGNCLYLAKTHLSIINNPYLYPLQDIHTVYYTVPMGMMCHISEEIDEYYIEDFD